MAEFTPKIHQVVERQKNFLKRANKSKSMLKGLPRLYTGSTKPKNFLKKANKSELMFFGSFLGLVQDVQSHKSFSSGQRNQN